MVRLKNKEPNSDGFLSSKSDGEAFNAKPSAGSFLKDDSQPSENKKRSGRRVLFNPFNQKQPISGQLNKALESEKNLTNFASEYYEVTKKINEMGDQSADSEINQDLYQANANHAQDVKAEFGVKDVGENSIKPLLDNLNQPEQENVETKVENNDLTKNFQTQNHDNNDTQDKEALSTNINNNDEYLASQNEDSAFNSNTPDSLGGNFNEIQEANQEEAEVDYLSKIEESDGVAQNDLADSQDIQSSIEPNHDLDLNSNITNYDDATQHDYTEKSEAQESETFFEQEDEAAEINEIELESQQTSGALNNYKGDIGESVNNANNNDYTALNENENLDKSIDEIDDLYSDADSLDDVHASPSGSTNYKQNAHSSQPKNSNYDHENGMPLSVNKAAEEVYENQKSDLDQTQEEGESVEDFEPSKNSLDKASLDQDSEEGSDEELDDSDEESDEGLDVKESDEELGESLEAEAEYLEDEKESIMSDTQANTEEGDAEDYDAKQEALSEGDGHDEAVNEESEGLKFLLPTDSDLIKQHETIKKLILEESNASGAFFISLYKSTYTSAWYKRSEAISSGLPIESYSFFDTIFGQVYNSVGLKVHPSASEIERNIVNYPDPLFLGKSESFFGLITESQDNNISLSSKAELNIRDNHCAIGMIDFFSSIAFSYSSSCWSRLSNFFHLISFADAHQVKLDITEKGFFESLQGFTEKAKGISSLTKKTAIQKLKNLESLRVFGSLEKPDVKIISEFGSFCVSSFVGIAHASDLLKSYSNASKNLNEMAKENADFIDNINSLLESSKSARMYNNDFLNRSLSNSEKTKISASLDNIRTRLEVIALQKDIIGKIQKFTQYNLQNISNKIIKCFQSEKQKNDAESICKEMRLASSNMVSFLGRVCGACTTIGQLECLEAGPVMRNKEDTNWKFPTFKVSQQTVKFFELKKSELENIEKKMNDAGNRSSFVDGILSIFGQKKPSSVYIFDKDAIRQNILTIAQIAKKRCDESISSFITDIVNIKPDSIQSLFPSINNKDVLRSSVSHLCSYKMASYANFMNQVSSDISLAQEKIKSIQEKISSFSEPVVGEKDEEIVKSYGFKLPMSSEAYIPNWTRYDGKELSRYKYFYALFFTQMCRVQMQHFEQQASQTFKESIKQKIDEWKKDGLKLEEAQPLLEEFLKGYLKNDFCGHIETAIYSEFDIKNTIMDDSSKQKSVSFISNWAKDFAKSEIQRRMV